MNATVTQPPKSILLSPRYASRHGSDGYAPLTSTTFGVNTIGNFPMSPFYQAGKVNNLRNYYARRRPTLKPPSPPPRRRPPSWVNASEQEDNSDSDDSDSCYSRSYMNNRVERRVHFRSKAIVHDIPSWKAYSTAAKKSMWVPRKERKRMMTKNQTEFAYDGRDWRNATEEEEFARDEEGQLVHPVHVAMKQKKRAPQEQIMSSLPCKKRKVDDHEIMNSSTTNSLAVENQEDNHNTTAVIEEENEGSSDDDEDQLDCQSE